MHSKTLKFEVLDEMFDLLIFQGASASMVAGKLGISRRAIHAWTTRMGLPIDHGRFGGMMAGMRSRVTAVPAPTGVRRRFRHLTVEDRAVIQAGRQSVPPLSCRAIAAQIGKSPATVSREIKRHNLGPLHPPGTYQSGIAHAQAVMTKAQKKPRRHRLDDPWLFNRVATDLDDRYSPQQIAGRLRREFPDCKDRHVSHETIYQALYLQGAGSLREALKRECALRSGRQERRPASKLPRKSNRPWLSDAMITDRPPEACDRKVPGHWEGDLVVDSHGGGLVTLVERWSRMTLLAKLPGSREAATVAEIVTRMIASLPEAVFTTITWDQGQEMARHHDITVASSCKVYFCDPHSPWQRPTNENTNGLVREYYPKGTVFNDRITDEEVKAVQDQLNRRPRKVLDYATPAERLAEIITTDIKSKN